MGVKTTISLKEANNLFPSFNFKSIIATTTGHVDTTYVLHTETSAYILKKYENRSEQTINEEIKLLNKLNRGKTTLGIHFKTSKLITKKGDWFIYEKLKGKSPTHISIHHIQTLARYLAKFHQLTYKQEHRNDFIIKKNIETKLKYTKENFYFYYKKLEFIKSYTSKKDGIIHGNIFKDNVVFFNHILGVFDFIDAGNGNFTLDVAILLMAFDSQKHSPLFINIFVNTYNQHAPKKILKQSLKYHMDIASSYYALERISIFKSTSKAKELIRWI